MYYVGIRDMKGENVNIVTQNSIRSCSYFGNRHYGTAKCILTRYKSIANHMAVVYDISILGDNKTNTKE